MSEQIKKGQIRRRKFLSGIIGNELFVLGGLEQVYFKYIFRFVFEVDLPQAS